jgi:HSP20 family protein
MVQFSFIPSGESSVLASDIRELFDELASSLDHEQRAYSGECRPALDVIETDEVVEIVMDVSGVPAEAIRVLFRAGVLIVAGEKAPPQVGGEPSFHLLERQFGRFARGIRLEGAFNIRQSRATLRDGELVVTLTKLVERRGRGHRIPVTTREEPAR